MLKKFICYVIVFGIMLGMIPAKFTSLAASSNDGTVYTDTWIPGTDNGQSGDVNKLSVATSSAEGESYYVYTSLTGVADAPLIYKQRTVSLSEMTFMLTESTSSIGYMPVFYDKAKSGEIWTQMMTVSPNGGIVISNIKDYSNNTVFTAEESGWINGNYTLVSSISLNKKHTIRVEHDPDNLRFTVRFDGHSVTLKENQASSYVLSTKTGSADAHNAKGPRFVFKAARDKSFKVYDMYMRGTVATNTNSSKAATVFSGARAYTYPGELKVLETLPANNSYGIKADQRDMYVKFNYPLNSAQPDDFEIDVSYTSDGNSYTQISSDGYTHSIEDNKLNISFVQDLKKGVTYKVTVKNIYSLDDNPLANYSFSFITDDGTTDILNAVNGATNIRNIGLALNTYKTDIGLPEADYANINANRNVITWVSRKRPYTKVEDIKATALDAVGMKAVLDDADEETISSFIYSYDDKLFDDTTTFDKYDALSNIYQAMVNSIIILEKPFNTLVDFIDSFNTAVGSVSIEVPSSAEQADKLICDFTKTGTNGWTPSKAGYSFINEATPDFAPGITLGRYYIPETTTDQYRMDFHLPYNNVSDCEALYIWAYSPQASGKQFALVPYCGTNDAGQWVYFNKAMTIDFVGWKLITIPFTSFAGTRSPSWSNVQELRIAQAGMGIAEAKQGTEIYFAKMWFGAKESADSFTLVNSNVQNGTRNFGIGDTLEFDFSKSVYFNPGNPPYIVDSNGNKISSDVSASGNTLLIKPVSNLEVNTAYTVYLSDICTYGAFKYQSDPILFTTADAGLSAKVPVFSTSSLPASGSVSCAASFSNTSSSPASAKLVIAAYNENGRMIKSVIKESTVAAGASDKTVVATINLDSYSGITLKAFTINNSGNFKPVNKKIAVLKDSNAPADKTYADFDKNLSFTNGNIAIESILINLDAVTLKTCINQNMSDSFVLKVTDSAGNLKYISQITADAKGCVTVEFALDPDIDDSGKYKVEVSSMSMTNAVPVTDYFYFIDNDDRLDVLSSVNACTSETQVASCLDASKDLMSILNVDHTSADNMYISHVIYRDKPYGSYSEILEKYNKTVETLVSINDSYWSSYSEIIESGKDIIFDVNIVYNSYNALSITEKNKVSQNVYAKRPFKSFESFVDALGAEIISLGNNKAPSTGPSSPSRPSGGYTAGGSGVAVNPTPQIPSDTGKYVDLEDCSWAESYIYNLKDKGVLTMGADKKFRPNDNITREEYVKMLVLSLEIPISGDSDFGDVDKNTWYYSYISAAYNAGIVNGVDSLNFGVGQYITREQMATIAYRALKANTSAGASAQAFSDENEISDYAKDAVYYMQNKGIINGIGNNLFAPKDCASRAQAAKIISMLCEQ